MSSIEQSELSMADVAQKLRACSEYFNRSHEAYGVATVREEGFPKLEGALLCDRSLVTTELVDAVWSRKTLRRRAVSRAYLCFANISSFGAGLQK